MSDEKLTQPAAEPAPTIEADPLAETQAPRSSADVGELEVGPPELRVHSRYRVVRLLGHGGMGAVYQALHKIMDRTVALKVMRPDLTRNPEAIERFRREVKAAAHLVHPNIVTAYDAEQVGTLQILVMEYVDGQTLASVVATVGRLPVPVAADYIAQAAQGLQHAFENGMIHRDIKPHNLMVTRGSATDGAPLVKILDFGLARFVSEEAGGMQTASGLIVGTVDFMAPEQADHARNADIRSDIYSLGCTLYYLLAGRAPFPEGSIIQRVMAHVERQPPSLRPIRHDIPDGLIAVLQRMMAKKPADRFQTPVEVIRSLQSFRNGALDVVQLVQPQGRSESDDTVLEAIAVPEHSTAPSKSRSREAIAPAKAPAPRKGRVLFGCFLLAALAILSATGLLGYGIWLIVNRVSTGVGKIMNQAMQQAQAWDQLDKDFRPPAANAPVDQLFPKRLGPQERTIVDDASTIPDMEIDLRGRHAVYGRGAGAIHVYAFQPLTRLEKEALFRRVTDLADKEKKSAASHSSFVSGSPKDDRVEIRVERRDVSGKSLRVRAGLWWSHDWLCIVRTPLDVEPNPLLLEYLHWLIPKVSEEH